REDFKEEFINTRSYRSTEDQVGRDFDRAENYLSLVGLIIVILGGIAVSSVTRVFILQKIRSIAVLKCVGARSGQIIAVYVLQVMTLGLAGSLLGVGMAQGAIAAIPLALGSSTSILAQAHYGVTWSAAVQGVGIGVLVSLLFSVVPLLQVRFIKPSLLLRDEATRRRSDWTSIGVLVAVSLALVTLTAWQASSLKVGVVVCSGFAGLAVILHFAGRGLITLVARPRIHHHVSRSPRSEREGGRRRVLERAVAGRGGLDRACHRGAVTHSRRRHHAVRHSRPQHQSPRDEHSRRRVAGSAERRLR